MCTEKLQDKLKVICRNEVDFYNFAYELRKYDTNEIFTEVLLKNYIDGLAMQILLSNKWNKFKMVMEVRTFNNNQIFIHN